MATIYASAIGSASLGGPISRFAVRMAILQACFSWSVTDIPDAMCLRLSAALSIPITVYASSGSIQRAWIACMWTLPTWRAMSMREDWASTSADASAQSPNAAKKGKFSGCEPTDSSTCPPLHWSPPPLAPVRAAGSCHLQFSVRFLCRDCHSIGLRGQIEEHPQRSDIAWLDPHRVSHSFKAMSKARASHAMLMAGSPAVALNLASTSGAKGFENTLYRAFPAPNFHLSLPWIEVPDIRICWAAVLWSNASCGRSFWREPAFQRVTLDRLTAFEPPSSLVTFAQRCKKGFQHWLALVRRRLTCRPQKNEVCILSKLRYFVLHGAFLTCACRQFCSNPLDWWPRRRLGQLQRIAKQPDAEQWQREQMRCFASV